MTRPALRVLVITAVAALALGACGGGGGSDDGGSTSSGSLPSCPVKALDQATKPVEVTFWHGLTRANEETLQQAHIFRSLSGTEEQKYQAQFQSILLGS